LAAWIALRGLLPAEDRSAVALVVGALLLAAPPVGLALFVLAVRAVLALPGRLRELPAAVGSRAGEIRRRAAEVGQSRTSLSRARRTFGLLRAVSSSREVLEVLTPAAVLLRPWLLIAAPFAAAAAAVEILLGLVAVVWLLA
jgi:hypothetical protein